MINPLSAIVKLTKHLGFETGPLLPEEEPPGVVHVEDGT